MISVADALAAFWSGMAGSPYALISGTLLRATPLLTTGLAVAIAFRAGVLNIGAEGQFLAGATGATWIALTLPFGPFTVLVALAGGVLAGMIWAGIAAELRRRYGVLEVISTILLNFVALYLIGWLVRGPLQEPTHIYPQSSDLPAQARLPLLMSGERLHWGFVIGVLAAVTAWAMLRFTATGFRVRATGDNPTAAAVAGRIDVARVAHRVLLASGALAGLGGAIEVTGVTYALYDNISPGYGYTAIAVALLAGLEPVLVIPSAIFFGALEAGAAAMQRDANVPSTLVNIVEAAFILALLAVPSVRRLVMNRSGRTVAEVA